MKSTAPSWGHYLGWQPVPRARCGSAKQLSRRSLIASVENHEVNVSRRSKSWPWRDAKAICWM